MKLNHYIDHTLLKATATETDILTLCDEAIAHSFKAVCVNSCYVPLAARKLAGTNIGLAAVVGFPLGATSTETKVHEADWCRVQGATEIDMVLNIGMLKSGKHSAVQSEITNVKEAIGSTILKVILETCYLSDEEIVAACTLAVAAGADFVKTSTGFGSGNATPQAVQLMKKTVADRAQIKASGGIRTYETALAYVQMGATRIGTSSGVTIVTQKPSSHEPSY
ncbi:MAG: deoxyribose-phosphate aldolase [Flavobacteriaceae bacterium]|nr:deoxyribose-phosphate aldolase [Flavobacteriaceae bacterium]